MTLDDAFSEALNEQANRADESGGRVGHGGCRCCARDGIAGFSPKQKCDWLRSERFIKLLSQAGHRIIFEIAGNHHQVGIYILCHHDDFGVVRQPFRGEFELCELTPFAAHPLREVPAADWDQMIFGEWFPPPPYSHLLTRPDELKRSTFATLIAALAEIPAPAVGIYQVIFAPVSPAHNWHQNVETLLDIEYQVKLVSGVSDPSRYLQQAPSGQLNMMAGDVDRKAHSDKPFYGTVLRIGLVDGREYAAPLLRGLAVVAGLIQHGGRPLCCLTHEEYRRVLTAPQVQQMFLEGVTYRPGFLLNSWELVSLVHLPPPEVTEHLKLTVARLEPLQPDKSLLTGTPIGICSYAGRDIPVCIPKEFRYTHLHMIAKPGKGKSTLIEHMFLYEVGLGHGAIVLDPHGRLIQRLLCLIPREHANRVMYFNPGDPDWVPLWNPIQKIPGQDLGTTADNLVNAFKKIVANWGDRLENLLRQVFYAALNIPGSTLLDVLNMLRNKTKESDAIRDEVLRVIDNEAARQFWLTEYKQYGKDDLGPPKNKLGKLLMSDSRAGGVFVTVSHQFLSQFSACQSGCLSAVSSMVIFRVDVRDAEKLQRTFSRKASVKDLITLTTGHSIARIGNHVVRVNTPVPQSIPANDQRDDILARSRRLYCRPAAAVAQPIRCRYD